MSILITGAAGFIGSNLARILLERGETVFGVDNLCRGSRDNLAALAENPKFVFAVVEMTDLVAYRETCRVFHEREPVKMVWHLAANSDIPAGVSDANVDLRDTFMTTFNTLAVMKEFGVGELAFASSSAIYGDLGMKPLVEDIGPLLPISNYGAMKLASEAAISAAAESHLSRAHIFRFPNVIGTPATHGVILDFVRKLRNDPLRLPVLGDGTQQKCYLHVEELVEAMIFITENAAEKVSIHNIGASDEGVTVRYIAEETVRVVAPGARIEFAGGSKGWVGDVPRFIYSVEKLARLGWHSRLGSAETVRKAVRQIAAQETGC